MSGYVGKAGIKYPKLFLFKRNHTRQDLSFYRVCWARIRTTGSALLSRFGIKYLNLFNRGISTIRCGCVDDLFFLFKKNKTKQKIIWGEFYSSRPQHKLQCQYRNSNNYIVASIHQSRLPKEYLPDCISGWSVRQTWCVNLFKLL